MYINYEDMEELFCYSSYPLIDKVLTFEPGAYIYALKNVSFSDPGFSKKELLLASRSLFLIIESVWQLVLLFLSKSNIKAEICSFYLGKVETRIYPGDTLCLELKVMETKDEKIEVRVQVLRDGQAVCSPNVTLKEKLEL